MAGNDTRQQILGKALSLFNQYGYGSVNLKQIADELQVDRRNVSYHFDKVDLLQALVEQMWQEREEDQKKKRDFPSFQNLDEGLKIYNRLQEKYAFIFNDLFVIQHPLLHESFKAFCADFIADCEQAIAFAIHHGNMKEEPLDGAYRSLCESILAVALSRPNLRTVLANGADFDIRKMTWSLIIPHFTPRGVEAFKLFFGETFYNSLGPKFNVKVKTILF